MLWHEGAHLARELHGLVGRQSQAGLQHLHLNERRKQGHLRDGCTGVGASRRKRCHRATQLVMCKEGGGVTDLPLNRFCVAAAGLNIDVLHWTGCGVLLIVGRLPCAGCGISSAHRARLIPCPLRRLCISRQQQWSGRLARVYVEPCALWRSGSCVDCNHLSTTLLLPRCHPCYNYHATTTFNGQLQWAAGSGGLHGILENFLHWYMLLRR